MRFWPQYVENIAIKQRSRVGEMTSRAELERQCSAFNKLFGNCKRCNETRLSTEPNIYLTSRRTGLSASAELDGDRTLEYRKSANPN